MASEFYGLTGQILSDRGFVLSDNLSQTLILLHKENLNHSLFSSIKSNEILVKLFETRPCQISLKFKIYLKLFDFLSSLSLSFNRHTLAIFFGNAFPSFLAFLANLFSIKSIYCSNNVRYLHDETRNPRGKRRFHGDFRAFLVILIESFSVITISWGIPIFLTLYYCGTLYVVSISACPRIQNFLAIFLFADLFNSSTNCLLYSLSGKLFRRTFLDLVRWIFTCGRSKTWQPIRSGSTASRMYCAIDSFPSSEGSTRNHAHPNRYQKSNTLKVKISDDDRSISLLKHEDESISQLTFRARPQILKQIFIGQIRSMRSKDNSGDQCEVQQTTSIYLSPPRNPFTADARKNPSILIENVTTL